MPASDNMNKTSVRVSLNGMEAFLYLPAPDAAGEYTIQLLKVILAQSGIINGLIDDAIAGILERELYNQEVLVARGTEPVDGIDGYYEYMFQGHTDSKPMIRDDGSADYWSVNSIEQVTAGQVIAVYHPPIQGTDGMDVRGKAVMAKRGKEQPMLKGKGFKRSEDNCIYTAEIDGKIESQNDRVVILPIYEVSGDADVSVGNIDFRGDVVIHGNVENGISIKASGTITIDGTAEACNLEAGKDIILRGGMLGGNKASVVTRGNIFAKFFENTAIEADGSVQADVFMNCRIKSKEKVVVKGNRGSIIGGEISAVQGVESYSIGNDAETKTVIYAGAGTGISQRLALLQKKVAATKEELGKIEEGLAKFKMLETQRGTSYANDPRRVALLRIRIRDMAVIAEDEAEIKKLEQLVARSKGAVITVSDRVYPGVFINIDSSRLIVKNIAANVEFYLLEDSIRTRTAK